MFYVENILHRVLPDRMQQENVFPIKIHKLQIIGAPSSRYIQIASGKFSLIANRLYRLLGGFRVLLSKLWVLFDVLFLSPPACVGKHGLGSRSGHLGRAVAIDVSGVTWLPGRSIVSAVQRRPAGDQLSLPRATEQPKPEGPASTRRGVDQRSGGYKIADGASDGGGCYFLLCDTTCRRA